MSDRHRTRQAVRVMQFAKPGVYGRVTGIRAARLLTGPGGPPIRINSVQPGTEVQSSPATKTSSRRSRSGRLKPPPSWTLTGSSNPGEETPCVTDHGRWQASRQSCVLWRPRMRHRPRRHELALERRRWRKSRSPLSVASNQSTMSASRYRHSTPRCWKRCASGTSGT